MRFWPLAASLATAVVLALGLGGLTFAPQGPAAPAAIVLVVVAGGVYVRLLGLKTGLVALLIATCFIDRYTYRVGQLDMRAEQVAALLAVAVLAYWYATRQTGREMLRPNTGEALLGVWFVIGLASSLTAAVSRSRSLRGLALLTVSSLGLLLPRRLIDRTAPRRQMDVVVGLFLLAFAAEAAYGLGTFLAHVFGSDAALAVNVVTGHLSTYGTLWEPNVFGAMCAAGAIAWAWLGPRHFRFAWLGIALCLGGTIASFTRAAWVAGFVVLALSVFARQMRHRAHFQQLVIGLAGAVVLAVAVVGAESVATYYVPVVGVGGTPVQPVRHGLFGLLANPLDVIGRVDQIKIAAPDIRAHLLIGGGIASFGQRHPVAGQAEQHIANLELAVINDTGILGLLVFMAFAVSLATGAWRRRRDPTVAGLGVTAALIGVTNVATETTELMITWLILGLLMMAVDVSAAESPPGAV